MAFFGADVEELRKFAAELNKAAQSASAARSQLTSALSKASGWNGPDAEKFRGAWKSTYSPNLVKVSAFLEDACADIKRHATEQHRTSNDPNSAGMAAANAAFAASVAGQVAAAWGQASVGGSVPAASADPAWDALADFLSKLGVSADTLDKLNEMPDWMPKWGPDALKRAGLAGDILGAALTFQEQYNADLKEHPNWSDEQRFAHAATAAGMPVAWGAAGTAAGGAIGGPVGALIGGEVGSTTGEIIFEHPEDAVQVGNAMQQIGALTGNPGVSMVGGLVEGSGNLILWTESDRFDSDMDRVGDAVDSVSDAASDAGDWVRDHAGELGPVGPWSSGPWARVFGA